MIYYGRCQHWGNINICWTMFDLADMFHVVRFEKYIDPLKSYLGKYRESVKGERIADKKPVIRRDIQVTSTIPFQGMSHMKATHLAPIQSYQSHGSGPVMSLTPAPLMKSEYSTMLSNPHTSSHKWTSMPPLSSNVTNTQHVTMPSHPTHASPTTGNISHRPQNTMNPLVPRPP